MSEEPTWQQKRDAGIKASLEKKKEKERDNEKSAQLVKLQSEVELLRREVMAVKKAHNALLNALGKTSPSRSSTTYSSFYIGDL